MKILRMTRVLFDATSSPFLLAATIKYYRDTFKETNQKAVKLLDECLYVDDLIGEDEDENEAKLIYEDVRYILKISRSNMRKRKTNCANMQGVFDEYENGEIQKVLEQKVLGYKWNYKEDLVKIESQNLTNQAQGKTKLMPKKVLKTIGKLYDPIGFIRPFTIRAKILMQEIWRLGADWDDPLPLDFENRIKKWTNELSAIQNINIPQHYFRKTNKSDLRDIQMHCFLLLFHEAWLPFGAFCSNSKMVLFTC
ncbi:hypothetical protein X975_26932, partial [Stegodyphus mimosarum]